MNTAKFIRILGYIVWTILWLPVTVFVLVSAPVWLIVEWVLSEDNPKYIVKYYIRQASKHLKRGINFINKGEWCKEKESN